MTKGSLAIKPLPPGSTIGILGGGQLGRMLALAAANLGMRTHIYCPDAQSPAFEVTPTRTIAAYDDKPALDAFAQSVDVVTYEFENVPAATAQQIASRTTLFPDARALKISQDRLAEKRFLQQNNIAISPFAPVENADDLQIAVEKIGLPAVLKTTRLGYDGKGQHMLNNAADAGSAAGDLKASTNPQSRVLEAFVPFAKEISIIVARNAQKEIAVYDPAENIHVNHILDTSTVPARINADTAENAVRIAKNIVEALDYVGVLAVEFFVLQRGQERDRERGKVQSLLVNEIAPRVHNSGHWTQSVCPTSQFEQHIRAICNWPLGSTTRLGDVTMQNLIGDAVFTVPADLGPLDQPTIYGKSQSRPGRKMGHVNRVTGAGKTTE